MLPNVVPVKIIGFNDTNPVVSFNVTVLLTAVVLVAVGVISKDDIVKLSEQFHKC